MMAVLFIDFSLKRLLREKVLSSSVLGVISKLFTPFLSLQTLFHKVETSAASNGNKIRGWE
jgi:hypothetical protein